MSCSLLELEEDRSTVRSEQSEAIRNALTGTLVSSLHRLKDADNQDGGFFVFGDLSVKHEGFFRLRFSLYQMEGNCVHLIKTTDSQVFTVHATKNFPGMQESTFLTRSFSDQGVRLRLRKEPRAMLRKRGPASDDYEPRHYNTAARRNEQAGMEQQTPPSRNERVSESRPSGAVLGEPLSAGVSSQWSRSSIGGQDSMFANHGSRMNSVSSYNSTYQDDDRRKRQRTASDGHAQYTGSYASPQVYSGGAGQSFAQENGNFTYSNPQSYAANYGHSSAQQSMYPANIPTQSPHTRESPYFTGRPGSNQIPLDHNISPLDTSYQRSSLPMYSSNYGASRYTQQPAYSPQYSQHAGQQPTSQYSQQTVQPASQTAPTLSMPLHPRDRTYGNSTLPMLSTQMSNSQGPVDPMNNAMAPPNSASPYQAKTNNNGSRNSVSRNDSTEAESVHSVHESIENPNISPELLEYGS